MLATAVILSLLCSLAMTASLVYAANSQRGLSEAESHTCGNGHEKACTQICGFIRCVGLGVKDGVDLLHS
jgi:hypothetical protein